MNIGVVKISKKVLVIAVMAAFLIALGTYTKGANSASLNKMRVTKDQSAIHATKSGKTIGHLPKDYIIEVTKKDGNWFQVKNGKSYAWIWNQYTSTKLDVPVFYKASVTKDKAPLHISNSGKAKITTRLKKGKIIEIVEKRGTGSE